VILTQLLPSYVRNSVYRALVETAAGEQGPPDRDEERDRQRGRDAQHFTPHIQPRRQAQITQEIAEIVGGSAALEG